MSNRTIRMQLEAYDQTILEKAATQIIQQAQAAGASVKGPIPLPTEKNPYPTLPTPSNTRRAQSQPGDFYNHYVYLIYISKILPKNILSLLNLEMLPSGVTITIRHTTN